MVTLVSAVRSFGARSGNVREYGESPFSLVSQTSRRLMSHRLNGPDDLSPQLVVGGGRLRTLACSCDLSVWEARLENYVCLVVATGIFVAAIATRTRKEILLSSRGPWRLC